MSISRQSSKNILPKCEVLYVYTTDELDKRAWERTFIKKKTLKLNLVNNYNRELISYFFLNKYNVQTCIYQYSLTVQ